MTIRKLFAALLCAALALFVLVPAAGSVPAEAHRGATKVKDLILTLSSTDEPESGSMVSFAGSGPASLAGVSVVLRRQVVSDGQWIKVTKVPIAADGTFEVEGVATGVGANKWQVQAIQKTGSGKKATKTKHLSGVVSTTVFAWYYLPENYAVDSEYMDPGSVTIGGTGYPKSIYAWGSSGRRGRTAWAEYNISYRCKAVNAKIGVDDQAETGFRAKFYMLLDGAETSLGQLGLGPAKDVTVDSASRLRLRVEVRPGDGIPDSDIDGSAAFGDLRALCSGKP